VAAGAGGRTVYVAGYSSGVASGQDYTTIAYNAATAASHWVRRRNGPGNGNDTAAKVAVSPGGRTVFVTGTSADTGTDYATIAYNAATGAQRWARRYDGPGNGDDTGTSLAVSPSGHTLYVTGYNAGAGTGTVANNAATGARLWVSRYTGPAGDGATAFDVAVSPDGSMVFVTGSSLVATDLAALTTIAYKG
jgi:hypothetical protein